MVDWKELETKAEEIDKNLEFITEITSFISENYPQHNFYFDYEKVTKLANSIKNKDYSPLLEIFSKEYVECFLKFYEKSDNFEECILIRDAINKV